ncbi:MAG TPA: aminotransferase class IV [Gemmatales bacterium]|nr:aminotransferase class IV [Gemmatales bacterium]HMP15715.1 aminotransferase class IV [Gemmatales bacterium]
MIGWAYQAGNYLPLDEVRVPLHDAGLAMGITATDQCRTYRQQLFRLDDHLLRFQRSCSLCKLQLRLSQSELKKLILEVLARSRDAEPAVKEWTVVWILTGGTLGSYIGLPGGILQAEPELIIYSFPVSETRFQHYYEKGAIVRIPRSVCSLPGPWTHAKQRSRLHWWLAEQEVKAIHPQAQALLLDSEGYLTETASANCIFVVQGKLSTPRSTRVLQGISLQAVKELAEHLRLPLQEEDWKEDDLDKVEEAFLTSTPYGIAPIGNLEGRKLPIAGPVFQKLWNMWQGYCYGVS